MTLQAQLQQLSQQVNQQVCVYTDRGFDIKDVGSGMTHAYGEHYHHDSLPGHPGIILGFSLN